MPPPTNELIREPNPNLPVDERAREENRDIISNARRNRRELNAKHWAFMVLVWFAVIAFCFVIFVKVWHLVVSPNYVWLDGEHIKRLDDFITTGVIGGSIGGFFKARISNKTSLE